MPGDLPLLDTLLAQVLGAEHEGTIMLKSILTALAEKAAKGDLKAAEMLLERAYGKIGVGDNDNNMRGLLCTDEQFSQLLNTVRNGAAKSGKSK